MNKPSIPYVVWVRNDEAERFYVYRPATQVPGFMGIAVTQDLAQATRFDAREARKVATQLRGFYGKVTR